MDPKRRQTLRIGSVLSLAIGAGLIKPSDVFAADWPQQAYDAKSLDEAIKALGGEQYKLDAQVQINAPDIAENGAVVPILVSSSAANTGFIGILVEKNPNTMSAAFYLPSGTEAQVTTRIKMNSTSNVYALAKADGKWLMASKEIKVTLGGCGG